MLWQTPAARFGLWSVAKNPCELRMLFIFLNVWGGKSKEELYFVTREIMKLHFSVYTLIGTWPHPFMNLGPWLLFAQYLQS